MTTLTRPIPRAVTSVGDVLRWRPLVAFFVTLVTSTMLVAVVATAYAVLHSGSIFPGVSVAGISVGGLDQAAAEAKLRESLPALSAGTLSLSIDGEEHTVPYADVGRDYAIGAMLDRAFAVGRAGGPLEQAGAQLRTLVGGVDVAPLATWDEDRLMTALNGVISAAVSKPVDAAVARQGEGYAVTPAVYGRSLDIVSLRGLAAAALIDPAATDRSVALNSTAVAPHVDTAVAQAAVDAFNAATGTPIAITAADVNVSLSPAQLRSWVRLTPINSADLATGWTVIVDRSLVSAYVAPLATQVDRQPADARLAMTKNGIQAIPGVTGQALDANASVNAIIGLIQARAAGSPTSALQLAVTTTEPSVTSAQVNDLAARFQMVSSWTTRYFPGPSNFFGKNISLPAKILNGTVVGAGKRFSFLDAVGEISTRRGFGPGGAIIRGHTAEDGAIGGGICSASTTLFNAALRAGYDIVDRTQHSYYINRYPVGLDATVFRSAGSEHDMVFVNDSQYPLWIRGFAGHGKITFQIWTIPDGRTVKIGKPTIENRRPATDTTQYVTTLAPGVKERVEYPVDGFDSWVTRTVRDSSGRVIHNETYYSHYIMVTGLTQIGISPVQPPPSEPPPPAP